MGKKSAKNTGSAKYVERPKQFDCIQFHGPEDFDDGVLADFLKKYNIKARITGPLDYTDDGKPNGEILLELYPQRSYSEDEPIAVWEGAWIVITNERTRPDVMSETAFESKYMPANKYNS